MNFVSGSGRMDASEASGLQDESIVGYPNPVENTLFISGVEDGSPVGIMDMSGRPVLKTEVQNSSVNVTGLNTGFYIVQIRTKERFIKMKVSKK
jgi:hypothetical protein